MKNCHAAYLHSAAKFFIFHSSFFILHSSLKKEFMDNNNKKLTRSRSDRKLAGVCGALAAYFGLDPSRVRIGNAFFTIFTVQEKYLVSILIFRRI